MNTIATTITSPTERNQAELKSGIVPTVKPKVIGYSDISALTMRGKNAELKNCKMKVAVVVLESRTVSVSKPTQSTSMIQTVLRT